MESGPVLRVGDLGYMPVYNTADWAVNGYVDVLEWALANDSYANLQVSTTG